MTFMSFESQKCHLLLAEMLQVPKAQVQVGYKYKYSGHKYKFKYKFFKMVLEY